MWVFTKEGFYSVVCKDRGKDEVLIRTRCKDDLLNICSKLNVKLDISKSENSDYLYETVCKKQLWAKYLSDYVFDLDYDNVKENIAILGDKARMDAYQTVWSTMYNWLGREANLVNQKNMGSV